MGLEYDISADPGTNATGICIWLKGEPVALKTIRPKTTESSDYLSRVLSVTSQFRQLCIDLVDVENSIRTVAIEEFEWHNSRLEKATSAHTAQVSMSKCNGVKCALAAVAFDFADEVTEANKKQIKKSETALLARCKGLKGSKDALDAYQIGVCAGLDRRRL
ncbi:MAG: hypothetical protein WC551_13400 [Patescibacteria group bacterium]